MRVTDLQTPALLLDVEALESNLRVMSEALPGSRLRPHVKAHKCTSLARMQAAAGHPGFTCATIREAEGMARAGLGADLLIANELVDTTRVGVLVAAGHRVMIAVDSAETIRAAVSGGVSEVLIDVNVGLPRCGVAPEAAGELAERARRVGLVVRGVMGYEGHAVGVGDRSLRSSEVRASCELLAAAHRDVGGEIVSAGGTGSFDLNDVATEIQAGSYVLMDTAYGALGLPFLQALFVLSTVLSVNQRGGWAVADCGLKALGMDHGNPAIDGMEVWFCSDEHVTFGPGHNSVAVGDRLKVVPAHCDPTVAYHDRINLVRGDEVIEQWPVDLRGW